MHLLFYGPAAIRFVTWSWIRKLLKDESIRRKLSHYHFFRVAHEVSLNSTEGKIYDTTDPKVVLPQIQSFIATYSIDTSELLEPDLKKYPVGISLRGDNRRADVLLPCRHSTLFSAVG